MQPGARCPLRGYHSHALSDNAGFYPKVKSQDCRKLRAMRMQLETWASSCCMQGRPCSDFSSPMGWHHDNALTQHSPTASAQYFLPDWKGLGKYFSLLATSGNWKGPWEKWVYIQAHVDPRGKKWGVTTFSLAEEKIGSLACNWKSHIFSCCSSSNKTRGIASSVPRFSLLSTMANTTLLNKYQPYSKLNPILFLRHLEKYDIKLQTMPMPLSSLSSSPSSPEDGNCVFSQRKEAS